MRDRNRPWPLPGAVPTPLMATTGLPAILIRIGISPPRPKWSCSVTAAASTVATPASTALPPCVRMRNAGLDFEVVGRAHHLVRAAHRRKHGGRVLGESARAGEQQSQAASRGYASYLYIASAIGTPRTSMRFRSVVPTPCRSASSSVLSQVRKGAVPRSARGS